MNKMYTEAIEHLKEGWVKDDTLQKVFDACQKDWKEHYEYRQQELKRAAGVARIMNQVVGAEVY